MLTIYWLIGILILISIFAESKEHEFNRNQTGVVFSPYVKNWINGSVPNWKNYTMEDVIRMLEVVSTKFTHISTYGMGAGVANAKWNEGDAVGLTAVAAAQLNFKNKKLTISVVEGIWPNNVPALYKQEITNAFAAASEANTKFPNTVTGIVLSSFSWMGFYRSWIDTVRFLQEYRILAKGRGLKIGVRLDICGEIIPQSKSGPEEEDADMLICTFFPPANVALEGTQATVTKLGSQIFAIEKALKQENKDLTVAWETGWPSQGVSRFGSENTVKNLRNYWKEMDGWAKSMKTRLYMYTAFDEPWKNNPASDKTRIDPEGPNGAEAHFGWWSLKNNNDINSFAEKEPEPEPEIKFPHPNGVIPSDSEQNRNAANQNNATSNGNKFGVEITFGVGILTPIMLILL